MPQPTTTVLPRSDPIVPTVRSAPFNDPAWLFEPKYDGFRGVLYLTRHSCTPLLEAGERHNPVP
jgi:ATP-dependent DNA ligase